MLCVKGSTRIGYGFFGICIKRENSHRLLVLVAAANTCCRGSWSPAGFRFFQSQHCCASPWKATGFRLDSEKGNRRILPWKRSKSWNSSVFHSYGSFSSASLSLLFSLVFHNANSLFHTDHFRSDNAQLLHFDVRLNCNHYFLGWNLQVVEGKAILKPKRSVLKSRHKSHHIAYFPWRQELWRKF